MYEHFLPVYRRNAERDAEKLRPSVESGSLGQSDLLLYCQHVRIASIATLLLTVDTNAFFDGLRRSSQAYQSAMGLFPRLLWSRAVPFFDAVACGDIEDPLGFLRHTPTEHVREYEYEEEVLYMTFLLHFFLSADLEKAESSLQQYEELAGDGDDARLDVCRAFFERDHIAFNASVEALMVRERDRILACAESLRIAPEIAATEGQISVEGLALVAFAEQTGIQTHRDYPLIPSVARRPVDRY
jgi:hypothetical protein